MPGSILNVDNSPTHLQIRQQVKNIPFLLSVNPTTAMKENQRRPGARSVSGNIQIEFQLDVACFCIGNVWEDVVINRSMVDPAIRLGNGRSCYPQITQNK